jgi:predicted ATPase/DNA-binding SARP family transcriptional activator
MAQDLEIRLFGGLRIALDGVPLTDFMSQKVPALLAYLALNPGPQRRDDLAALLWGELPDADARNNLRQALANLRRALDAHLLVTRETVELRGDMVRLLDVNAFERGLRLPHAAPLPTRIARLEDATALYRGDFLGGFFVRDAPTFEEWMLAQRARFRELALHALHTLTQFHLDAGRYDRAISDATRLLALDAWREETHRQLMLALARTGQRSAALAQYKRCRRLLADELEVEPSAETTALYEQIKAAMRGPRHNLPPLAGLVGRATELAELHSRLAAPDTRLLTILGPGGAGKTRLALEAAAASEPIFLNGVWLASLAEVAQVAALPAALADALGFAFSGAGPLEPELLDFLRRKELLLVLDNFEHLISPPALDLVCQILNHAPGVKLLVTSRERLNLAAEWLYDLAGLPFPANGGDPADYPAVQLFAQRAQRVRPDFALTDDTTPAVARICRLVEGLPLAIELAAAAMRTLTPADLAAELSDGLSSLASAACDLPERHRSLAAVFDHSWARLDATERRSLAQLAVCRGGFDRAAAEAVAAVGPAMLQALADRSLVRVGRGGRCDMHPLVQQFARDKLAQREPACAQTCDRHARHFAALARGHEAEFYGEKDRQALARLLLEADNIRAAWEWGVGRADPTLIEPFVESFLYFFDIQGRYAECVALTGAAVRALRARGAADTARGLGRVLALHAAFEFRLGAFEAARHGAEEALALLEPLAPLRDIGHGRLYLGAAWYGLGDLGRSVEWFLAAARAYEAVGHAWGIGAALDNAGYLEFLRGDIPAAEAHLHAALAIAAQTGSRYLLTGVYDHLATLTASRGRFAEALGYVERCRAVLDEMDRPYIVASLSLSLGQIAAQAGDTAAAEKHVARALELARATGNRLDIVKTLVHLGEIQVTLGNFAAAELTLREASTLGREIRAESLLGDVVAGLADLAAARGQRATAITLYRVLQREAAASQGTVKKATDGLYKLGGAAPGADLAGESLSLDAALARGLSAAWPSGLADRETGAQLPCPGCPANQSASPAA